MTNPPPPAPAAARVATARAWLIGFLVLLFVCQVALLSESLGAIRVVFRVAAYAISLAALGLVPGLALRHPSRPFLWVALGIVFLEVFHPTTNTPLAGLAQFGLYLA